MTVTEILARFLAERDGFDDPNEETLAAYRVEVEAANLPEKLYSAVVDLNLAGLDDGEIGWHRRRAAEQFGIPLPDRDT